MPLTAEEKKELQMLEQEEMAAQQMIAGGGQGLTVDEQNELALLEQEEAMAQQMASQQSGLSPRDVAGQASVQQAEHVPGPYDEILSNPEADLGFATRAKYSIEPLDSNRRALLAQEFGPENLFETPDGMVFIKQDGQLRPVNAPGISTADVAELLGAGPEIIGATMAGLVAAPSGPGAYPAAVAGGMAGSTTRQAISAGLGTPQVASIGERALDIGLSGALSGAGKFVEGKIKPLTKKVVKQYFPKFSKEGVKLSKIAKEQGLPDTTFGQKIGGAARQEEKVLERLPIVGRKYRKIVENQEGKIMKNLKKQAGDFIDAESMSFEVADSAKDLATAKIQTVKNTASELFEEVAEKGSKLQLPAQPVRESFLESADDFFNLDGTLKKFNPELGISQGEFERVQKALLPISEGLQRETITPNSIDAFRKTIDSEIRESSKMGFSDTVLLDARKNFLDLAEKVLDSESPELKNKFKSARALWRRHYQMKEIFEKGGKGSYKGASSKGLIKKVFRTPENIEAFKNVTDQETVEKMGGQFLFDIFQNKTRRGRLMPSVIKDLQNNRHVIQKVFGKKRYNDMLDNVRFLSELRDNPNVSGTAWTEIKTSPLKTIMAAGWTGAKLGTRKSVRKIPEKAGRAARAYVQVEGQERKRKTNKGLTDLVKDRR